MTTQLLNRRILSSISRLEITPDNLSSLESLIMEYEKQDRIKQSIISQITRSTTKTISSIDSQALSKNKKITVSYDKSNHVYVTETMLFERTSRIIEDDDYLMDDGLDQPLDIDSDTIEEICYQKLMTMINIINSFGRVKGFDIPKQITMENLTANSKTYACIYYTVYGQFRGLPIYTQSLSKIQEYLEQVKPQVPLGEFITKDGKEYLRETISKHYQLNALFTALRLPDLPLSIFSRQKKISFLILISEAVFQKKKKANKKKPKRKGQSPTSAVLEHPTPLQNTSEDYQQILDKICAFTNHDKYPFILSPEYLASLQTNSAGREKDCLLKK